MDPFPEDALASTAAFRGLPPARFLPAPFPEPAAACFLAGILNCRPATLRRGWQKVPPPFSGRVGGAASEGRHVNRPVFNTVEWAY